MNQTHIAFAFVILIVAYLSYYYGRQSSDIDGLQGFWETDKSFNEESGIKFCSMYIGKPTLSNICKTPTYPAYVLMLEDDSTILINEPIRIKISPAFFANGDERTINMTLSMESDLWASDMTARYYPITEKLVLSDNDTIYAVLFKNSVLSEMERISADSPKTQGESDDVEKL